MRKIIFSNSEPCTELYTAPNVPLQELILPGEECSPGLSIYFEGGKSLDLQPPSQLPKHSGSSVTIQSYRLAFL